jgi:hypothetical protein
MNIEDLKIQIKEHFDLVFDVTLKTDTLYKLLYNIQILLNPSGDDCENINWVEGDNSHENITYNFKFEYFTHYNRGDSPFYSYVWFIEYNDIEIKKGHIWKDNTQDSIDELYTNIIKLVEFSIREKQLIEEINKW